MTRAGILREKIAKRLEARGIKTEECPYMRAHYTEERDRKTLWIDEVYRHNGTEENCSVKIRVTELMPDGWRLNELYCSDKITEKTSERVINKRIDAALEKYLYTGLAPAQEGLDLFFEETEA